MVKYLRSLPFGGCVWGSGVRLDGGAPLPSFFEVVKHLIDSPANDLRTGGAKDRCAFVQRFSGLFVHTYVKPLAQGIVRRWTTHLLFWGHLLTPFFLSANYTIVVA